jgi:hypothetical protein
VIRMKHIAARTPDSEKTAALSRDVSGLKKVGQARAGDYLSDGYLNLAILKSATKGLGKAPRLRGMVGMESDRATGDDRRRLGNRLGGATRRKARRISGNCHDSHRDHVQSSTPVGMKERRETPDESRAEASSPEAPELPTEKALVIRLSGDRPCLWHRLPVAWRVRSGARRLR